MAAGFVLFCTRSLLSTRARRELTNGALEIFRSTLRPPPVSPHLLVLCLLLSAVYPDITAWFYAALILAVSVSLVDAFQPWKVGYFS